MHDEAEGGAWRLTRAAYCRVLQHFQVTVGVAEGHDRSAADEVVNADGFAGAIVDEFDPGLLDEHGFAVLKIEFHDSAAADDLLGWNAIGCRDPRAHEFDAAAGDNKRFKAAGAEIVQQHDHRLIDALVIGSMKTWM